MSTVNGLRPAAVRVLEFILAYTAKHDRSPSYAEIAAGLGTSASAIGIHLGTLEARGWIRREGRLGLALTGKAWPGGAS